MKGGAASSRLKRRESDKNETPISGRLRLKTDTARIPKRLHFPRGGVNDSLRDEKPKSDNPTKYRGSQTAATPFEAVESED